MKVLEKLKDLAKLHPSINMVESGDIFNLNTIGDVQYPIIWVDLASNATLTIDTIKPIYRIYYVDRLLEDKSNQMDIESDSMVVLNQLIAALANYIPLSMPVTLTPFQHKFNDVCAGGYIELPIEEDTFCSLDMHNTFAPYFSEQFSGDGSSANPITLKDFNYLKVQDLGSEFKKDLEGLLEITTIPLEKVEGNEDLALKSDLEDLIEYNDFNSTQFELNSSNKVTIKDGIIPTDVSDLDDNTNLIPPHLFFDDTYFSGAGTQVDPKSLRTENLPSGGGGVAPKRVATWVATDDTVNVVNFTHWDNGDPFDISKGFEVRAAIDIENIVGNKGLVLRLNNKTGSANSKIQNSLDLEGTLSNLIRTIKLVDASKLITQVVYMRVLKKGTEIMGESINTGGVNSGNIFYSDGYNLNTNITTINCINLGSAPKWLTGSTIIIYEL